MGQAHSAGHYCCGCCCIRGRQQQQPSPSATALVNEARIFFTTGQFTVEDLQDLLRHIRQAKDVFENRAIATTSTNNIVDNTDVASTAVQHARSIIAGVAQEAATSFQIQDLQIGSSLASSTESVLSDVLRAVGSLHWAACALSLVAYLLRNHRQGQENKEAIAGNLDCIMSIVEHIIHLAPHFPNSHSSNINNNGDEVLKKATCRIAAMAYKCCSVMDHTSKCCSAMDRTSKCCSVMGFCGVISRTLFADTDRDNLHKIAEELRDVRERLIALASVETLNRLPPATSRLTPNVEEDAVDMDRRVQEVRDLFSTSGRVIVLHGMGGVGKTTLMEAVAEVLTKEGGYSYHRVKLQQNPNIPELQKNLLARLTGKEATLCDFMDGQAQLAKVFERPLENETLICLDDVWKDKDLNELLPRERSIPSKVKFLITTRNEAVKHAFLESSAIKTYKVDLLSEEMSEALLLKALRDVGASVTSHQSVTTSGLDMVGTSLKQPLVKRLLKACAGHPLAIKLAGSHIYINGGASHAWEQAINRMTAWNDRLGGDTEDLLSECLGYVLDNLSDPVKNAFLDIVAFWFNESSSIIHSFTKSVGWLDFVKCGEVGDVVGSSNLKDLEDRSLVELNVKGAPWDPPVKVHDLLVAMARQRIPEDSRLTSLTELLEVLRSENVTKLERVEGICVTIFSCEDLQLRRGGVLQRIVQMHRLRVLVIRDVVVSHFDKDPTPSEFSISPRAPLRVLWLREAFMLRSFPQSRINVNQLSWLKLDFGSREPADTSFSKECMTMEALRKLELCNAPASAVDIILCKWSLPVLAELTLYDCEGVTDTLLEKAICQQQMHWSTSLTHLSLVQCNDLEVFPELKDFKELKEIDLTASEKLRYVPLDLTSTTSLRHLQMDVGVPENIYDALLSNRSELLHTSLDEKTPAPLIIITRDKPIKKVEEVFKDGEGRGEMRARAAQHLLERGQLIDDQGREVPSATVLLKGKVVGLLFINKYIDEPGKVHLPHEVTSICKQLERGNKEMQYVVVQKPYGNMFLDRQWKAYLPLEPMPKHWVAVSVWDFFTRNFLTEAYGKRNIQSIDHNRIRFSFVFTVLEEGCMHTAFDALHDFGKWGVNAYPFTEEKLQQLDKSSSDSSGSEKKA